MKPRVPGVAKREREPRVRTLRHHAPGVPRLVGEPLSLSDVPVAQERAPGCPSEKVGRGGQPGPLFQPALSLVGARIKEYQRSSSP